MQSLKMMTTVMIFKASFVYIQYTHINSKLCFFRLKILVDEERMPPFEAIFKIGLSSLFSRWGQYNNKSWPQAVSVCARTSRKQKAGGYKRFSFGNKFHILNCIAKKTLPDWLKHLY